MKIYIYWPICALTLNLVCVPAHSEEQAGNILTLKQVHRIALENHPRVSAARSEAVAADERVTQTSAAYMPEISASANGIYGLGGSRLNSTSLLGLPDPALYTRTAAGLTVEQLITDFGRTADLVEASELDAQAGKQNIQSARLVTAIVATEAYFKVLLAQEVLKVWDETVATRQKELDQIVALTKGGMKSSLDVGFAKVNLVDAEMQHRTAINKLHEAQAALTNAMGSKEEKNIKVAEEPFPSTSIPPFNTQIETALQLRPDLESLRLKHKAALKLAEAESYTFKPKVELIGNVNAMPWWNAPSTVSSLQNFNAMGGIFFTSSLFNGFKNNAKRDEAKAKALTTEYNLTDAENQVFQNVRSAWLAANTAYDLLKPAHEKFEQAKKNLELALSRYNLGLGSIVEFTQAQLNLTKNAIGDADARIEYQLRRLQLDYQTGKLQQESVALGEGDSVF
jgi:outer membrane protein